MLRRRPFFILLQILFFSTAIARNIASTKNVSWVLIDGEGHFYDFANVIAASGVSPLVHVPAEEVWLIKCALDSGAHCGSMVPMANSTACFFKVNGIHDLIPQGIVWKVVQATKYPLPGFRDIYLSPLIQHYNPPMVALSADTQFSLFILDKEK
ncbi:uncharacterized protein EV420DRAFT_1476922 [Desarmillaria tabescens]|uniref:Uncharacterized protein n=1 Tax=Armillaria tabescens TaxID=1929756 RepID=A0AA39NCS2_ARMTA|nr:uncharacterized protein EV420DRAFT_1476922 [Desarmillaria tabescens]KAK0463206.1 hypothetical protein EV420DRAFT_1476922 [Desarmillaria tabescens]